MVGKEVVEQDKEISALREGAGEKRVLTPRVIFERRPHPMWTYFIRGPEGIKIGKSKAPRDRRSQLQLAHASELEIIVSVPESQISEAAAHEKFQYLRLSGEWFREDPELLAFIEGLKGAADLEPPEKPRKQPDPIICKLHALRDKHGVESAVGYGASNLTEQLHEMKTYQRPAWAKHECQMLPWMMERQVQRIEHLTR